MLSLVSYQTLKSYDDKKPSKYIMYLDTNNLYRRAMSQYLLYDRFKWLHQLNVNTQLNATP